MMPAHFKFFLGGTMSIYDDFKAMDTDKVGYDDFSVWLAEHAAQLLEEASHEELRGAFRRLYIRNHNVLREMEGLEYEDFPNPDSVLK
jgi:hypothetical protein